MSKLTCHIPIKPIMPIIIGIILVLGILVSSICITSEGEGFGEGFAIYLTKQDIPPAQMEDLSHVDIAFSLTSNPYPADTYSFSKIT